MSVVNDKDGSVGDDDRDLDRDPDDAVAEDPALLGFLKQLARVDDLMPPDEQLHTGQRLGRFTIVKRLGHGGMGAVYEAKDETLGRIVALKVMRRSSDEHRKRFVQEARAAAAVSHANLVTVHEVGEADGRAFIVMEHVRGKTLRAIMTAPAAAKPSRDAQLRILREIARGMAAAHAVGIVHRDLKPENVIVSDDGGAKVLDFGIARFGITNEDGGRAATAVAVTGTGVVVGTPQYMSPEQALGHEVDARSDVYSFGVLAHELLVGTRPEPDAKPAIPTASELDPILARCLAAQRSQRFADARELAKALDESSTASASIAPLRPAPALPRRRRAILVGGALAVAAGVATIAFVVTRRTDAPKPVAPTAAPPRARTLMDVSGATTSNPQALAAYRGAMQSFRDAMTFESIAGFERAVQLDPGFAAAHLRLALMKRYYHNIAEARAAFQAAVANRTLLDDRDRVLLEAAEPSVAREPLDYAESKRRFVVALDKYPGDFEMLYWLGMCHSELGEQDKIEPLLERITRVDPTAPAVFAGITLTKLYLGDRQGAREAAVECRRIAPMQSSCAFELEKVLDDSGACSELETTLRGWMIASPDTPRIPETLGKLMLSEHRPLEAVRDMFAQARARMPEPRRALAEAFHEQRIAWHTGDLAAYDAGLQKRPWDPGIAEFRIDVLEEMGRRADTRALAETFFKLAPADRAMHGTSDRDLYNDRTGIMLATMARTGAITPEQHREQRDAWLRDLKSRIRGIYARGIWSQVYAEPVRTPAEAADAIAAMPSAAELAPFYWFTKTYGDIGRALVLGGRHADAISYLERATRRCIDRDPRDYYHLGVAKEAIGDTGAACTAYRGLLDRWNNPKPRSITVEQARARVTALACPSPAP